MTEAPSALEDLPPSAKFVYKVLQYEGPLTQSELVDETHLPQVTVRSAIDRLEDAGLVDNNYDLTDARKKVYNPVK